VITGGIYAFQVGGAADVGLGFQPTTDDLTSGTITLKVQNTSGAPLTTVRVSYDLYCYNDQGRANSVKFSYSTDDTTYTAVSALDYTSPEAADSSPAWEETDRVATLSFSVAAADYFYLRWTTADVSGSGSRDEFALDDITVSVPEPGATAGVGALALTGLVLFRRRRAGA
jgi:HAMP domain-containing protein